MFSIIIIIQCCKNVRDVALNSAGKEKENWEFFVPVMFLWYFVSFME